MTLEEDFSIEQIKAIRNGNFSPEDCSINGGDEEIQYNGACLLTMTGRRNDCNYLDGKMMNIPSEHYSIASCFSCTYNSENQD